MAIKRMDSQQTTCNAFSVIDGERRQVAAASCTIRPGRGMTFAIDLMEGVEITVDDLEEVTGMFRGYLADELKKAGTLGIPIE